MIRAIAITATLTLAGCGTVDQSTAVSGEEAETYTEMEQMVIETAADEDDELISVTFEESSETGAIGVVHYRDPEYGEFAQRCSVSHEPIAEGRGTHLNYDCTNVDIPGE